MKKNIFILILAINSFIFSKNLGYIIKDDIIVYREEIEGAKKEYELLFINKENFEILLTGNPAIAMRLLKTFVKRIYVQKRRFMILTIQDNIARIGDVFLMLDETQPDLDRSTQMRTFIITPEEVARWAGLSAEATGDALRKFADQGRLEVYGDRIIVKNIVDLSRFVTTRRTKDNVFG